VILPPAEQAIYLELQQLLAGSDFKMKKRKANNSNDRERRVRELLGNSESPGEALIKSASYFTLDDENASFTSADETCDALVELREKQLAAMKYELHRKVEQAEWLYRNCRMPTKHFQDWKSKTSNNGFGDPKALGLIKEIIDATHQGYNDDDWKRFYSTPTGFERVTKSKVVKRAKIRMRMDKEGDTDGGQPALPLLTAEFNSKDGAQPRQIELRNVVNDLHKKSDELIARCRSLRYLETIRGLQKSLDGGCSCGNCGKKDLIPEEVSVLQQCGHVLCNMCLEPHAGRHLQCLVMHCHAHNRPHEIFPAKGLCINVESSRIGRRYGQKIGEVVQLVESIPKDEQVLLFVQFEDLMAKFAEAFRESGICYAKLIGKGNTSKILEDFQTNKDNVRKKVLLLNMGDETAAGR
jgi:SNF2 family DNA or RNA helicase